MANAPTIIDEFGRRAASPWRGAHTMFLLRTTGPVVHSTGPLLWGAAQALAQPSSARTNAAARSPIMIVGALVLPPISRGITEASAR